MTKEIIDDVDTESSILVSENSTSLASILVNSSLDQIGIHYDNENFELIIAPEGTFVVSPANVTTVWFSIFVMFSFFSVSRKVPKTGVVFVAAAGECLVK